MIFKLRLKSWQASLALTRLTTVVGVNSTLPGGFHILMWDFDNLELPLVKASLGWVQEQYDLPCIHILNTGKPNHYIAYCFEVCTWIKSVAIIASTWGIDQNYFRLGVIRKHWTLRISDKEGQRIHYACMLPSLIPQSAHLKDLTSFTEYDTMKRGVSKKVITIGTR
jgi:hypothetical protein